MMNTSEVVAAMSVGELSTWLLEHSAKIELRCTSGLWHVDILCPGNRFHAVAKDVEVAIRFAMNMAEKRIEAPGCPPPSWDDMSAQISEFDWSIWAGDDDAVHSR